MVCPNDAMFRRVKQSLQCMTVKGVEVLILRQGPNVLLVCCLRGWFAHGDTSTKEC